MKKIKYLCLTLVLSFLLTVPAFASQPQFSDVSARAACADAVTYLVQSEIVNGTGNNRFQPNAKITTSQWAAMLCRAFGTPETGSTWAIKSIQQACHAGWLNVTALQTPNDKVCRAVLYESAFAAATIPVYDSVLYDGVILMPYENILRVGAELGLCAANASPLELVTRAEAARLLYALLTQTLTVTEPPIPISLQNCMGVNMNAYLLELRRVPAPILEAFNSEGWTLLLDTKYLAELSRELNVNCIGATCCGDQRIYVSEASAVVHEFGHFLDDLLGFPAEHNRLYELEAANAPMRAHGKSDSKEYFAEFFSAWLSGGEPLRQLKDAAPQTYAYFEMLSGNGWLSE